MSTKTLRDLFLLLAFFGAIWFVFKYLTKTSESAISLSNSQKEGLEEWIIETIEEEYTILENDTLAFAIAKIEERLATLDTIPDFKIRVLDSDQINAFATFGNQIFIFSGLIEFCESPEEIAAILAHEIGHIHYEHVEKKFIKEVGLGVVTILLTGGDPVLASEIAKTLMSTAYDRRQEMKSDNYSMSLMNNSNLPHTALASFMVRLKREENMIPDELSIISTHPNLSARIENVGKFKGLESEIRPLEIDWDLVKRSIE